MTLLGSDPQTPFASDAVLVGDPKLLESLDPATMHRPDIDNRMDDVWANPPKVSFLNYIIRAVSELKYVKFAFASFVINGLRRRYQRSVLGFAWSLLNPLLMMIVLTTVFSLLFDRDPKSYGVFIFTGMVPWAFVNESIVSSCLSITHAENFMKKVYIPKIFFPLVTVTTELINFIFSLVSMLCLGLFLGLQIKWSILLLPAAILLTYLFVFGISLTMAVTTVYFRDLSHLVRVLLSCFFYLIPIVYPISAIPKKYEPFFMANPFSYFIMLFRKIIYYGEVPTAKEWLMPAAIACAALLMGFYVLMKREKDIIFRL
jgi:ABC-type polysaccharide/polyol phosphate export permease